MRKYQGPDFIIRLVYQGDHGIIRHLMSIMLVIYILHTLLIVPALAVSVILYWYCRFFFTIEKVNPFSQAYKHNDLNDPVKG